jgi:hypothetical protein
MREGRKRDRDVGQGGRKGEEEGGSDGDACMGGRIWGRRETRWGREEEGEQQSIGVHIMEQNEESERLEGPKETTTRSDGSDSNGSEKKQGNNQTRM